MNFRAPEDFVRHPVADSGKAVLHEQDGFDRRLPMSIQELTDEPLIKLGRIDFGNVALPPIGFVFAVMETHTTELALVGEDEHAVPLIQDEMIVFTGTEICGFDPNLSGHTEMDAEPV